MNARAPAMFTVRAIRPRIPQFCTPELYIDLDTSYARHCEPELKIGASRVPYIKGLSAVHKHVSILKVPVLLRYGFVQSKQQR